MNRIESGFWKKSYVPGVADLDPKLFEIPFIEAIKPTFTEFPDKYAIEFHGKKWTYHQIEVLANQFANALHENGMKEGDIMGLNVPNLPQYVVAWLGCLKAGVVISGLSPLLSAEQMEYQLKDLSKGGKNLAIFTMDTTCEKVVSQIAENIPHLKLIIATNPLDMMSPVLQVLGKHVLKKVEVGTIKPILGKNVVGFKDFIAKKSKRAPLINVKPDDTLFIQYTGGTTAYPKGAVLTNRSCVADMLIFQHFLQWGDKRGARRLISGFPFFHSGGLFICMNVFYLGWQQILIPNPRDTDNFCEKLMKYHPEWMVNVPALCQMLMKNPKFKTIDFSNLEGCITAASPFPEESQKQLESFIGTGKIIECYGMTETSPIVTVNPYQGIKKLGTVGVPLPNTIIKLISPETGEEVGIGEPGEICVKGPQVMKEYHFNKEETEHAIDKEGYMHTGDVGVFDEQGYLTVVDRIKDMIIVSGFKVFSTKIEEIIVQHPKIATAAIVGVPNPERPGSEIVRAYITLRLDAEYDGNEKVLAQDIVKFLENKCTHYEIPKEIKICKELPLTTVGKVDKKVLRKQIREEMACVSV